VGYVSINFPSPNENHTGAFLAPIFVGNGDFEEIEQGGELGGDDDLFVGLEVQRWGFIRP